MYENDSFQQPEPEFTCTPPQQEKPKKKRTGLKITALCLTCALIGGAAGIGGSLLIQEQRQENTDKKSTQILHSDRDTSPVDIQHIEPGDLLTAAQVYAQNVKATVGIKTSITTNLWGYQTTSAASGSGFVLSDDGYILTNYHVVENSSKITVSTYDGNSYDAKLIGYDESNDIAVLKIEAENLTPVVIGSSDDLVVGQEVVAIGNPLGELTFSLTTGVVSALNREVTLSGGITMNLVQTDCAINSGNSGGPLFNMYGEVVGITNAKYSSSGSNTSIDNIGFAIPIDDVMDIVTSIIEKGYIAKPYIGISVGNVSQEAQAYGLPVGAAVRYVEQDSPAYNAGIRANDIITQVGDTAITQSSDLTALIKACQPGDELTVKLFRNGSYETLNLTVGEKIQSATEEKEDNQSQSGLPGGFPWNEFGY